MNDVTPNLPVVNSPCAAPLSQGTRESSLRRTPYLVRRMDSAELVRWFTLLMTGSLLAALLAMVGDILFPIPPPPAAGVAAIPIPRAATPVFPEIGYRFPAGSRAWAIHLAEGLPANEIVLPGMRVDVLGEWSDHRQPGFSLVNVYLLATDTVDTRDSLIKNVTVELTKDQRMFLSMQPQQATFEDLCTWKRERRGWVPGMKFRLVKRPGIQAAAALEHARTMGIVHHNIKPGNLMIDDAGTIVVTDFGLARMAADSNLTVSGDVLGTLRYMGPEQRHRPARTRRSPDQGKGHHEEAVRLAEPTLQLKTDDPHSWYYTSRGE